MRNRVPAALSYLLLLVVTVAGLASILATANPLSPSSNLSPARKLVGTWTDFVPVTMNFADTFCGPIQVAGTQPWTITFVISPGATDNDVNVEMDWVQGPFSSAHSCASGGVVPEVSPLDLTGVISSSNLVLLSGNSIVGNFNFTTSIMTGTFNRLWTGVFYDQQEYTASNALTLTLQH